MSTLYAILALAGTYVTLPARPSARVTAGTTGHRALTIIEYVLMAGLIISIIAIIGVIFRDTLRGAFTAIQTTFGVESERR